MLQQKIYILYLIVAIVFPAAILFYDSNAVINIYATYFVVVPHFAAFSVFLLFFFYALNYFLMRKYISTVFGMINFVFLLIPLVYFFVKQNNSWVIDSGWGEILYPVTLLMFLAAILMFPVTLTAKLWKRISINS